MYKKLCAPSLRSLSGVQNRFLSSQVSAQQQSTQGWVLAGLAAVVGMGAATASFAKLDEEHRKKSHQQVKGGFHHNGSSSMTANRQDRTNISADFYVAPSELSDVKIFSGSGNPALSLEVAMHLGTQLGRLKVGKFSDGETSLQVLDNVRGKDVFIIQPTCPPINDNLIELFLLVSTMRRASAKKVTAVIPYYGYARQDVRLSARTPIAAADVARMLEEVGVDRVIAVDLHRGQIQGFFGPRVPVDNLDAAGVALPYFKAKHLKNPVVVSPDANGVHRAKLFRDHLVKMGVDAGLALIVQKKDFNNDNGIPARIRRRTGQMVDEGAQDMVGDVQGADVIIVDDMVDTGGRVLSALKQLKERGAARVYMFATHGLFSLRAVEKIQSSDLDELVITNTIPLPMDSQSSKIQQLSVSALIAEGIRRVHHKESFSNISAT
eukprot:GILJ01000638.1.p1 GENE.GILJ01000638.1~~GILJ01000638.1.p1  ORF type:complete len:436 (+),score=79.93 GILJ01000638.1:1415-2722(+)